MVFERKKIQLETLGEYLQEARQAQGLSVDEAAQKTSIKTNFLSALESGEFRRLPPDVYVVGFLKQLAELYSVESNVLITQYKKEKTIQNQIQYRRDSQHGLLKTYVSKVVITPKLISMAIGILFVIATMGYIIWQVASINKVPSLVVFEPQDAQVIKDTYFTVKGKTDPGINIAVNGQDVFVDSEGNFQIQLSLEPGPQQFSIVAKNKFDKKIEKQISVVGQSSLAATITELQLKLQFAANGILGFTIDDGNPQTLEFHNGDTKVLTGTKKIVISTTDAGATIAILNGQNLGPLGRPGEALANVPFFAEKDNSAGQ